MVTIDDHKSSGVSVRHYGITKRYNSILILKKLLHLGSGVSGYKNMECMDKNRDHGENRVLGEAQVICIRNSEESQSPGAMGRVAGNGFTVRITRFPKQKYRKPS